MIFALQNPELATTTSTTTSFKSPESIRIRVREFESLPSIYGERISKSRKVNLAKFQGNAKDQIIDTMYQATCDEIKDDIEEYSKTCRDAMNVADVTTFTEEPSKKKMKKTHASSCSIRLCGQCHCPGHNARRCPVYCPNTCNDLHDAPEDELLTEFTHFHAFMQKAPKEFVCKNGKLIGPMTKRAYMTHWYNHIATKEDKMMCGPITRIIYGKNEPVTDVIDANLQTLLQNYDILLQKIQTPCNDHPDEHESPITTTPTGFIMRAVEPSPVTTNNVEDVENEEDDDASVTTLSDDETVVDTTERFIQTPPRRTMIAPAPYAPTRNVIDMQDSEDDDSDEEVDDVINDPDYVYRGLAIDTHSQATTNESYLASQYARIRERRRLQRVDYLRRQLDFIQDDIDQYTGVSPSQSTSQATETVNTIVTRDHVIEETNCVICLEGLTTCNKFIADCGHQFHARCMMQYVMRRDHGCKRCPTCRQPII